MGEIYEYNDDWRIFARSSSDAKGPVSMFIAAIDAIDENGITPNFNIKVILDFEEEMGLRICRTLLKKMVNCLLLMY